MLTDSGVNAMSDQQQAAMMVADDSYAGSATYTRLASKLEEVFGHAFFLPAHQVSGVVLRGGLRRLRHGWEAQPAPSLHAAS